MSVERGVGDRFAARVSRLAHASGTSSLAPLLVVVLLAGCSALTRPAPVRDTFLLDPPTPAAVATPQPGTLRVGTVNVAAPFRGKNFVYRVGELRFETDYYVEFLVTQAAMLAEQTARALDRAKAFTRVAGPGTSAEAAWVLDAFVSALYADRRDAGKPAAELDIEYFLTPTEDSAQTPVWHHAYRERVPMRDTSPAAYAEAMNKAFGDILAQLARDLAGASLPKP
jgi:cholesterol transport system auxiliary component